MLNRTIPFGAPSRRVCWLIKPTAYDEEHLPEHFTLMYCITSMRHSRQNFPTVIHRSIDRVLIEEISKQMWRVGDEHGFKTEWYDPEGNVINKLKYVKKTKETADEA